ncbi:MAG: phosphomannomutase/phosphoglucomutase [Candidatus Liptonbacteria bacterium]|nr:phosphomannomutase/phosphoglucomutase [Candidatus Liptonbacteria bacterium]
MKVNPYIFRGYDLRGLVDTDLSPELAEHLGRAYGTYLKRRGIKELVVARDSRATGPAYSEALIRGLLWAGADVIDIGMHLVGTFYWSQYYLNRKGGVYISASHNPPEWNGFKFANDFSETLVSDGMQELRRMVEAEDYEQAKTPGTSRQEDIREAYYKDILARVPLVKKFKIVVDASATTAGAFAPELLRRAGCEVIEKNCVVDSSFPLGVADPTSSVVAGRLGREVMEAGADIGFTYDADGDRIGIVDEKGGIIWNDVVVELLALDVLTRHPGATIMYNTLCSKAVAETIARAGGTPFMWRVGHSFLKKKNQQVKAAFIGELSGHFFFSADFYNHDDGLYSTMALLRYLGATGKTLSEAVAELPYYMSSPEIKLFCADEKKSAVVEKIGALLKKEYPSAEAIDDERAGDGVRLDLPDAMMVARYSQNGPYLTIKFEGKTKERYAEVAKFLSSLLHQFSEIDWSSPMNLNVEALGGDRALIL